MRLYNYDTKLLLNMQILVDNLEEDYNISFFCRWHDEQRLTGASITMGRRSCLPTGLCGKSRGICPISDYRKRYMPGYCGKIERKTGRSVVFRH